MENDTCMASFVYIINSDHVQSCYFVGAKSKEMINP